MVVRLKPFVEIQKMESRRDHLFREIRLKFEDFEIIDQWQHFIGDTIPLLELLTNLKRILFNRYYDEYEKEIEGSKDPKIIADLLEKIKEIIQVQLENNVITDQYLYLYKISNINLDYKRYLNSYIENELQKKFIEELFFHSKLPNVVMDDISKFMREQFRSNKYDEILRNLSEQVDLLESNEDLLIERNTNKGHYYAYYLSSLIERIGTDWWWHDTELFRAAYNQAGGYFTNLLALQIDTVFRNEIEGLHNPMSSANDIYYKCEFYYNMGVRTAIEGIQKQAQRYFKALLELAENGLMFLEKIKSNRGNELKNKFEKIISKTELMEYIVNLSSKYNHMSKLIEHENRTELLELLTEIDNVINSYSPKIEVKYLSGLPDLYVALNSTLVLLITLDKSKEELSEIITQRLKNFTLRIDVATNQLVSDLELMKSEESVTETKIIIFQLLNEIEVLLETVSLVPIQIVERITTIQRLNTLKSLTLSIQEDIKAFEMQDKNIIKVLIHKAKANYYAKQAKLQAETLDANSIPYNRIIAQYNGSLVSGYLNEIDLFQLCIQYICINEILPRLITVFTNQNEIKDHKILLEELWNDKDFRDMLNQIKEDSELLIEYKQSTTGPAINGVQWNEIYKKKNMIAGLLAFYESIKFAIIGSIASLNEKFDDASQLFIQAQDLAFDASSAFGEVQTQALNEYKSHIFSFGQFTQDASNKTKMKNKIRLPVQEVIKLFRDILFNL